MSMPIAQGTVGLANAAVGTTPPGGVQQGRQSEVITADLHGRKYTAAYNGLVYIASTAVAGVAPGTAFSTTPPLVLWNPPGSGVNLELLRFFFGYVSGTLGPGTICIGQGPQATKPTTGTQLVPVNSQLGNSKTGAGQAFQGSTLLQAPTMVRPSLVIGAYVGGATLQPPLVDELDGELLVTPGNFAAFQGVAGAGSTPLGLFGLTWAENPV
jgi:hypothetical protein